jgi:acetyltransferase-like isoleucine patch superfamily enzyme
MRLLPFSKAVKLPILVRYNTKIINLSGEVCLAGGGRFAQLRIGFGNVSIFDTTFERSILEISGKIVVEGKATFGHGSRISVLKNGLLTVGDKFLNTAMMTIVCKEQITLGKNVLTSWNTLIMDTDFHQSINLQSGELSVESKPVIIGDNVWIGTRAVILKGSEICEGCIIGASSLVSRRFKNPNSLIIGNPAIVKKENVTRYIDPNNRQYLG